MLNFDYVKMYTRNAPHVQVYEYATGHSSPKSADDPGRVGCVHAHIVIETERVIQHTLHRIKLQT